MKYLKRSSIIALSLFLLFSINSHADILKEVDFEDGRVGGAGDHPFLSQSGNNPEIVTAQEGVSPRSGKYMMRTYLNRKTSNTNYRTEARLKQDFDKGKEYWVGISIFLPANWRLDYGEKGSGGPALQFHDYSFKNANWRPHLPLTVLHTKDGWLIRNNLYPSKNSDLGNLKAFSTTVPYKLGQWNDFVLNVKFSGAQSPNDTDGFIKVWVNGQLVLNQAGQNYFGEQTNGPYLKFGLYMPGWKDPESWFGPDSRLLFHDELRIGDAKSSYAEVSPGSAVTVSVPPSPPSNIIAQ